MLIDLHTHTRPFSWDSDLGPDDLVEAARRAGLDGICISDHDYVWRPDHVAALARRHNFLVLPAAEINTERGHMLCYGIEQYVYGMHHFEVLVKEVSDRGGVMVAAHPYRRHLGLGQDERAALDQAGRDAALGRCDAIEGLNGRGSARENAFSFRLAERLSKPAAAGSDSHRPADIGKCATEFTRRIETIEDLVEELRAGRFRPVRRVPRQASIS